MNRNKSIRVAILCLSLAMAGSLPIDAQKVTFHEGSISLKQAFEKLESSSAYKIAYNDSQLDVSRKVSMDQKDMEVLQVLSQLLKNTGYTYKINGNYVIIVPEEVKTVKGKKQVSGVIVDTNGDPVIGANVVEKGTTNGTITDLDGKFTLEVNDNSVLQVSYIGYNTQEVSANGKTSFSIKLGENTQTLDEVVVVGYGTMKKSDLTGSVTNVKAEKLLEEYDAVVLACGASNPRDIKVTGRDAKGIYFAVDFLKTTTRSLLNSNFADGKYVSAKGKKVLVIGGGDTGNDCVGTSIRQGAVAVTQLEMMPKLPETRAANNPWPEWPRVLKTDYGQQEAIAKFGHDPRIYETTVKEIVKNKDGQVCAAKCVKLAWEKDPETGRMNMKEIPDSEYTIECDLILIAAGFLGTQKYVADAFGVKLNARTNVETAPGEHKTNVDKVYTCGDMHRGQSLVVWAIREGRDAAKEVDTFLNGYSNDF